jgi:hypothetical protein
MYFPLDDFDQPDFLTLRDADRFHCILHSGEIGLADMTTMVLVIFVVRRSKTKRFDMFIINKFFRPDGSTNKTFMSKKDIPAAEIEDVISTTSTTFAMGVSLQARIEIKWDELDLRNVSGRQAQIERIKKWGKLTNVRVK